MTFFLHILISVALSIPVQVGALRNAYFKAATDEKQMPVLKTCLDNYRKKDHYYYCYLSAYNSLTSKYATSIPKKMEHFGLCKKNLEMSFKISDSFDARFIRFCVQNNTPRLLGYKNELANDKVFIMKNLGAQTGEAYKQNVKDFLRDCGLLSTQEMQHLEKL